MKSGTYEYQTEFVRQWVAQGQTGGQEGLEEGVQKGLQEGLQKGLHDGELTALFEVLDARGLKGRRLPPGTTAGMHGPGSAQALAAQGRHGGVRGELFTPGPAPKPAVRKASKQADARKSDQASRQAVSALPAVPRTAPV